MSYMLSPLSPEITLFVVFAIILFVADFMEKKIASWNHHRSRKKTETFGNNGDGAS